MGSNSEVDARIGEVCFAPMNGLRQSGLSGPKVSYPDSCTAANYMHEPQ